MALSKPVLKSIANFDATNYQRIEFTTNEQPVWLEYVVENNETGTKVAGGQIQLAVQSGYLPIYQMSFVLADSILTNGVKYRMRIRVGDYAKTNWSSYSNYKTFTCLAAPVVNITNFAETTTITEQNILLTGTYEQNNGDELAFYQFIVYNNDGTVFAEQSITHSQEISYYLTGLNSGYHYKIELKCTSQSGMESSSGLIETEVVYFQPNMNSVLELYNTEDAMVELRAVLAQIQGEINEYVSYYPVNNPDWLDITDERGILIIDNGLSGITDDYTIILWLKDIKNGKRLFKLSCTNGNITVIYEDNIFKAFTEINGVKALYMSDEFEAEKASRIKLAMFSQDSRIGFKVLECEKV